MTFCKGLCLVKLTITNVGVLFLILGMQLLTSCSSMDSPFLNNEQMVSFNPSVDSEYKYDFEDADEVIQEMGKGENKTRLIARNKVSLLYKILEKSNNGYLILVNFLSCEIENISDANASTELPENNSTYFHKSKNSVKGTIFKLNLALDGRIENVSGYKEYLIKNSSTNEQPYNENYFNDIFSRISQLISSHKIFIGLSGKQQDLSNNRVEYLTNDYGLEKITGGGTHIRSLSQVRQQILERNTKLIMTGIERGEIETEANTGMPLNCSRVMKLQGTCKIGGVDLAQTLVKTSTVLGKKIN